MQSETMFCEVNGYRMAYTESGSGDPIIFLHGNPTSSYLWRNIIPELQSRGRCIAPDLIGMGESDKLNASGVDSYRFVEHAEFLDGLLDCVDAKENVTLVIHDWGSALGFWWAYRNQPSVKGIVYMEAIVMPFLWDYFDNGTQQLFMGLRTPEVGETLVLEQNMFIEQVLPGAVMRNLTEDEMDAYRAPYLVPGEDRRPMLTWPREISFNGTPVDVTEIASQYSTWMAENDIPKLFINADPGAILIGIPRDFARSWKNQTEVTVAGLHFIQEDSPLEIAGAISEWFDVVYQGNDGQNSTSGSLNASLGLVNSLLVLIIAIRAMIFTK